MTSPLVDREGSTLRSRSVEALRHVVLSGRLPLGSRLNEVELAGLLGVSRGPLREAIRQLVAEGLLTSVEHRGAYVRLFTEQEVRDLYEVRTLLECAAARLAAERATPVQRQKLGELLNNTRAELEKEPSAGYPRDPDFHRYLLTLASNASLVMHVSSVLRQIELVRGRTGHQQIRAKSAFREHSSIAKAVIAGDGDTAERLMAAHLSESSRAAAALIS